MLSCAFFGHRSYNYEPYKEKLEEIIVDLVERGVTVFYNGGRGVFDSLCARTVYKLKEKYPHIKNILVLSYIPDKNFELPSHYDESVYLLTDRVPLRYAILKTNREIVKIANYIVSGVAYPWGGAKTACDYAKKLCRTMFNVVDGSSYCDYDFEIILDKEKETYRKVKKTMKHPIKK